MDNKKDILKELNEIAPNLKGLPKEDGFNLPNNYFAKMQQAVLERATKEESVKDTESFLSRLFNGALKPKLALASVLLLAGLSIGYLLTQQNAVAEECLQISCLTYSEIDAYVAENLYTFDEGEFESDIETASENQSWNFDDDVLENYLLEHSDDIDLENLLE